MVPEQERGVPTDLPLLVIPTKTSRFKGSNRGIYWWLSWLQCRRQADLKRQLGIIKKEGAEETLSDAGIGTHFHTLCEIYYKGDFDKYVISFEGGDNNPEWLEAVRLFNFYKSLFPANEVSRVVACEEIVGRGVKNFDPTNATTEQVEEVRKCMEKYGVPEIGAIIDMVVDIEEPELSILKKTRLLHDSFEPGRYLWDHKTKKQRYTNMEEMFQDELQFKLYMMLAEDFPAIGPVKGFITNAVIRHKELEDKKSFVTTVVPPPGEHHRKVVKNTLTKARLAMEDSIRHGDRSPTNPTWCDLYGGCGYKNVHCDRL